MDKFETRVNRLAARFGIVPEFQNLEYGYRRAALNTDGVYQHGVVLAAAKRLKNMNVSDWKCWSFRCQSGRVYIMNAEDYDAWQAEQAEKMSRVNKWWERWRNADEETRRLMACGKI